VVLGRSDIVGSPVVAMLRKLDATVTQCHSRTKDLPSIVSPCTQFPERSSHTLSIHQLQRADIVVSAIGKPEFVKGEWLKSGAIVIDVGTNYIPGMYYFPEDMDLTQHPCRRHQKVGPAPCW
jgi:methylenetetrahydrofolate dehydrogenase (NADP+) / methenyltetrahydrofolate cyclohydrolase / formyltetrahydrofolate synthetase